jgi:hypothetical protein
LNRTIHQFAFAMIGITILANAGTIGAILALA